MANKTILIKKVDIEKAEEFFGVHVTGVKETFQKGVFEMSLEIGSGYFRGYKKSGHIDSSGYFVPNPSFSKTSIRICLF